MQMTLISAELDLTIMLHWAIQVLCVHMPIHGGDVDTFLLCVVVGRTGFL